MKIYYWLVLFLGIALFSASLIIFLKLKIHPRVLIPESYQQQAACSFKTRNHYIDKAGVEWLHVTRNGIIWAWSKTGGSNWNLFESRQRNLAEVELFKNNGGPCYGLSGANCDLDTYNQYVDNSNTRWLHVTYQGKIWAWSQTNSQGAWTLFGAPGRNLAEETMYRQNGGPCYGLTGNQCRFTTYTQFIDTNNTRWLHVTYQGKLWVWYQANSQGTWVSQINGENLADQAIYKRPNGPCAGLTGNACQFETHKLFTRADNKTLIEVTKGEELWTLVADQNEWTKNNLADTEPYKSVNGPCYSQPVPSPVCQVGAKRCVDATFNDRVEQCRSDGLDWETVEQCDSNQVCQNNLCQNLNYSQLQPYFGDLHTHTSLSDGIGNQAAKLTFARDTAKLDFVAVTDHAWIENGSSSNPITPTEWSTFQTLNNDPAYNNPGHFVTLNGFEWNYNPINYGSEETKLYGHKNVYFLDNGAIYSPRKLINGNPTDAYITPQSLWQGIASGNQTALTIPHHPAAVNRNWDGSLSRVPSSATTDWNWRNDVQQPLVEIYSKWGSGECEGCLLNRIHEYQPYLPAEVTSFYTKGAFVQDALAMGFRLGFVGSGDSHLGNPGGQNELESAHVQYGPFLIFSNAGLTGVWANSLTRADIYAALKTRRTWATSGNRTKLKFMADGHMMGEEYATAAVPNFYAEIEAFDNHYDPQPTTIVKAEIVKGGIDVARPFSIVYQAQNCQNQSRCQFTWQDTSFNNDALYYLRVTLANQLQKVGGPNQQQTEVFLPQLAWSSPIWVNEAPPQINYVGKPVYDLNRHLGYFIWKENNNTDWHIRWTGMKNEHQFTGAIKSTAPITQLTAFSFEDNDNFKFQGQTITFSAIAVQAEDGLDFTTSGEVNFDLFINGERNDGLVYFGPNKVHRQTYISSNPSPSPSPSISPSPSLSPSANPACQYDYDGNHSIGIGDLLYLLNNWDNSISTLLQLLSRWGTACS